MFGVRENNDRSGQFWLGLVLAVGLSVPSIADEKPHVVMIVADDLRADAIGAYGNPDVKTPQLDRLIGRGTSFRRCYTMGSTIPAVCVCSRASLMTGRSVFRVPHDLGAFPQLPEVLRLNGYLAYATGKWHNGTKSFSRAFDLGGALFFGGMSDPGKIPLHPFNQEGTYPPKQAMVLADRHASEIFTDEAISHIRKRDVTRPMFLYAAFTAPHDPRMAPEKYHAMYDARQMSLPPNFMAKHPFDNGELEVRDEKLAEIPRKPDEVRRHLADYYAMITHLDEQLGRLVAALEASNDLHKTLIVFVGDNGLGLGSHGLMGKQNLYEHSLKVPLVFAGPGVPEGRSTEALCQLNDIFPTICQYLGEQFPDSVEGMSLAKVLSGDSNQGRSEIFAAYRDIQRSVSDGRYKLIRYPKVGKTQFFDLQKDPHEMNDLWNDEAHESLRNELAIRLMRCQHQFYDPLMKP